MLVGAVDLQFHGQMPAQTPRGTKRVVTTASSVSSLSSGRSRETVTFSATLGEPILETRAYGGAWPMHRHLGPPGWQTFSKPV